MTHETWESTAERRGPGRPRDPATDRAILDAAVTILDERGLQGVTISAVAERAGVSRATIYLRWKTTDALRGAMVRASAGGYPYELTGDLARDIRRGAEFARDVTSGEHFLAVLPDLFAAVLANPPQLAFHDVAPNRIGLAAEYTRLAEEQGFDASLDPNLAFDLLLGAQLVYILANRRPPSAGYVEGLADTIVAGLRRAGKTNRAAVEDGRSERG